LLLKEIESEIYLRELPFNQLPNKNIYLENMIYNSIRVQKVTKCNCSAYSYPHAWGSGDCKTSIAENRPHFFPPKRGLASELFQFLDSLQNQIELLSTDEERDAFDCLLQDFKKKLF
jgi:hypothetical protein